MHILHSSDVKIELDNILVSIIGIKVKDNFKFRSRIKFRNSGKSHNER